MGREADENDPTTIPDTAARREAAHLAYLATLTADAPSRFGSPEWDAYVAAAVADEDGHDVDHAR